MAQEVCVVRGLVVLGLGWLLACQTALSRSADRSQETLALVAQAQMALAEGQVEKGLRLFSQAVQLDPESPELREEYGLVLAGLGIRDKAIVQLQTAGQRSPEGEAVLGLLLAQMATSPAELEQAVLHLEKGVGVAAYEKQVSRALIEAYLRLGRGEEAWGRIAPLLGEHPDNPWLHLMAGRALRQLGRFAEAEEHLRFAAKVEELANQATGELVEVLASQGKYKEAAALLEKAAKGGSPTLPGLVRWGALLLRAGEEEKAIAVLDEALTRDPNQTDALILRAGIAFRQGKADEAEQFYRKALATAPEDPEALMGLARLLLELRRLEEARELLAKARAVLQRIPNLPSEVLERVVQEQAFAELLGRAYSRALPFLQELAKKPLSPRGVALWAEYFRSQKRFREGLEYFSQTSVSEAPEAASLARTVRAEFLLATGEREKGLQELSAMAQGSVEEVRLALAAAARSKLYREVIAWAKAALERFPEDEDISFSLAAAYERLGQLSHAEATFRRLLQANPSNAAALNYLGYSFADRGENLQEAKELIEKAVSLDPFSGAYLDSLGWVYFRLGDLDRAEKYLTEAATLEPFDPTVQEHLGDLYRARGEMVNAEKAYRRALALEPEEEGQEERIRVKLMELPAAPTP